MFNQIRHLLLFRICFFGGPFGLIGGDSGKEEA